MPDGRAQFGHGGKIVGSQKIQNNGGKHGAVSRGMGERMANKMSMAFSDADSALSSASVLIFI
ncbi:hypothetical protein [Chromobacterium violaceum]|uniref:hypothetical protein n=1 Tax=Chromobacterium violaceum TaxID=536 RepID=UPI0018E0A6B3|nr:hypothetical protein [Chromobacterium violaceum]